VSELDLKALRLGIERGFFTTATILALLDRCEAAERDRDSARELVVESEARGAMAFSQALTDGARISALEAAVRTLRQVLIDAYLESGEDRHRRDMALAATAALVEEKP